jgi:hypothetical protein
VSFEPSPDWGSGGIREIGKPGPVPSVDKKGKQPQKKRPQGRPAQKSDREGPPDPARTVDLEA